MPYKKHSQIQIDKIKTTFQEKPETTITNAYKVYHVLLYSNDIINMCSPEYCYMPKNWSKEEIEKRKQTGERYVQKMNDNAGFYANLEKSVLKEGFRNPILVTVGQPKFRTLSEINPRELRAKKTNLFCEFIGGSRLYVAQKYDLMIPAIVCDFVNQFKNIQELVTPEQVSSKFIDKPEIISFTDQGLRISPLMHTHLKKELQDPKYVAEIRREIFRNGI